MIDKPPALVSRTLIPGKLLKFVGAEEDQSTNLSGANQKSSGAT